MLRNEQRLLSEQTLLLNLHVFCINTGVTSFACMQGVQQLGRTRQHREAWLAGKFAIPHVNLLLTA